ncbi:UDP-glycosyltransferase 88B1 [Camellia lanceoleosa]|uniref:UDP-glycosyltransferase 88B1 n=1 Tax=Camellia lanceoleosa TaxID=1840588 RepID=A0ACC0J2J9_9ERIC|nr:UDP-glycosyltransferase 88B1 [Camellia lanceoleosa]
MIHHSIGCAFDKRTPLFVSTIVVYTASSLSLSLWTIMEDAIVLYPSPAIGHLISMVELGKLILNHYPSFSIKILITTLPYNSGSISPYINRVSATTNSITFHHLPTISLPPSISSTHHETLAFEVLRLNKPNVHQALVSFSKDCNVRALIIDFFCTPALSVAAELKIPAYYFFTSGACCLISFLYYPNIHRNTTKSLKDLNSDLDFPGLPPIPSTDMPKPILDRNDKAYEGFLNASNSLPKSAGIIVNTFESLEPKAIKTISDGLCVPDEPTPPLYCVGPLIAVDDRTDGDGGSQECLKWLDTQPSRSVVFLCFGSLGLFSSEQLKEIAVGLERSGQRFMWVVRSPPSEDKSKRFLAPPEPDLDLLLPNGFLDRTKERGLVVKSWAPQVAVLNHDSVGGFVTHCGWNSVLEAICAGVPMVGWPLYAEQRFNRVVMVEELKLALSLEESEDGFVSADEVEKRVRELMESESESESENGRLVRMQVLRMKAAAKEAMSEGGSSRLALTKLVELWTLG